MPRLIVREQGEERVLELGADKITIGRSKECSVVINDPKASREHCRIEKTQEGFLLTDMDSKNGTFLNGKPIEREILTIGDVVEIGDVMIIFERAVQPAFGGEISSPTSGPGPRTLEIETPTHPSPVEEERFALVVISGPDEGKELPVGDEPVTIGRHRINALSLSDDKVSGSHARIYKEGEVHILADLGSRNGTYIGSKKIEREVIDHNTIFTVGGTTLLFKDRTRREEMPSTAAQKEIPREGEFEAVDLEEALKEKKTSAIVTFLYSIAAVFLILSMLYFGFVIFGKILRTRSSESPPNSLITTNWSFEEMKPDGTLPGWVIRQKGWSLDENIKKNGKRSLLLDCSSVVGEEGIEAKYESSIALKPQTDYIIRAWVKTENILRCGVRLTWIDERNKEFRYDSCVCLASGTNNLSQAKERISPPLKASHFEIRLFALGTEGRCWFDDIEVEEQPAQTELAHSRMIALGDRMRAVFDRRAMFEIYRYSALTLWGAEVALETQEGKQPLISSQALCETEKDFAKTTESQGQFSGRIFDSTTEMWLPLSISVSSNSEKITVTARVAGALNEETGMSFLFFCPARTVDENGIELSTAQTVQTKRGEFQAEDVRELVLGSRDILLSVSYDEPFRVTATKIGSTYKVSASRKLKAQEKEPQISVTFSCISSQEAQRIEESLAQIERLRQEGRLSAASDLATRARATIAKNAESRARFDSLLAKIEEDGKALQDEMKKVFEDAKKTLHPEILAALEEMVEKTKLAFPDSDTARRAEELVNSTKEMAAAREGENTGVRAKRFLDIAKSYKDKGMLNLAIIYYEYVRDNFPDTEWQKEARKQLEIIEDKKRVEERW
jgi:pSer/pThr/pTyr-binding forkhead associated (FHA) protein